MDLNINKTSPVLSDPTTPVNKSRLGSSFPSGRFMMNSRKKIPKLDDVRSNGWLDAMISSSPPRKRLVKDFNIEIAPEDDFAQRAWMVYIIISHGFIDKCFDLSVVFLVLTIFILLS